MPIFVKNSEVLGKFSAAVVPLPQSQFRNRRGASSQGTVHVRVTAPAGNSLNIIQVTVAPGGPATVLWAGIPGATYILEASSDLLEWAPVGSGTVGANGLFEIIDADAGNHSSRYYRTRYRAERP